MINKKICLLGDFAVGKTSLVRRYVYNRFEETYLSTIGVHVSRKVVSVEYGPRTIEVVLMLWDVASNNSFEQMRTSYICGVAGAMLVCDLTRPSTLDNLGTYVTLLRTMNPQASLVIAANKSDAVENSPLLLPQAEALARRFGIAAFITSAKHGSMVEPAFQHLAGMLAGNPAQTIG